MFRSLALCALALAAPAVAQGTYQPRGFLRTGYSDRQLGPDRWEVRASSHDESGSVPVALYHAAEIATAAGVSELRVVKQKVTTERMVRRSDGSTLALTEKTQLTVRAIRADADRTACDMPETGRCMTLAVAGILSAYGPQLGMPAARPGETPAPPVLLVSTSVGGSAPDLWRGGRSGGPLADLLLGAMRARAASQPVPVAAAPAPTVAPNPEVIAPHAAIVATAAPRMSALTSLPAVAQRAALLPPAAPTAAPMARLPGPRTGATPAYEDLLRAARPVDADPRLGWTASR